jgi:hypothetical protein
MLNQTYTGSCKFRVDAQKQFQLYEPPHEDFEQVLHRPIETTVGSGTPPHASRCPNFPMESWRFWNVIGGGFATLNNARRISLHNQWRNSIVIRIESQPFNRSLKQCSMPVTY